MRIACALLLVAAAGSADALGPRLRLAGDVGQGYDTNVGNAEFEADVRESAFTLGALTADLSLPITPYSTVLLRGSAHGERYEAYDDLSNAKGTLLARWFFRANGDFHTPLLALWGSAAAWEFESQIRDGLEYRGGAFLVQQLNTAFSARLSLAAVRRESDSRVFDLEGASAGLNLDWTPARALTVYGGYQYYRGDVVSSATPTFKVVNAAEVIEPDDAFGGFATGQFAYRLDADSHIGTAGFNLALSRRVSLDLQGQHVRTGADWDNSYRRWISSASLLARF